MNPYSTSRLSPRDQAVVDTVLSFGQITTGQLRRLHFSEPELSPYSRNQRCCRSLLRLTKWKEIRRIPRQIGTPGGGSGEFVYIPPSSRREESKAHDLAVTELYVRLMESEVKVLEYVPVPASHERYGNTEIKPDARARLKTPTGTYRWYIEVDRGRRDSAEYDRQLTAKMKGYISAWKQRTQPLFPVVLFTVRDEDRQRFIRRVVSRQEVPEMFQVILFEEAASLLVR